jgi:acyl carrier protein
MLTWERALGVAGIGEHDNFFSLGGNSLLAVRIVTDLSELLEVDLQAATYVGWTTPAEMTDAIGAALGQAGG